MHIPALVTLHLPLSWYPQRAWIRTRGRIEFLCVSDSQKRDCPRELAHTTVLENGVALPNATNRPRSDYGLVLGRICPEKNQHAAVVAGTLAHKRVLLGGRVFHYPEHERYFHEKLEPLLWQNGPKPRHEFLGPLSGERKLDLLARARCLLGNQWPR